MKKSWNEMNLLEKGTAMLGILMAIVGYGMMFYAFMVAVGLWTYEHTQAIIAFVRGLGNLMKRLISRLAKSEPLYKNLETGDYDN